MKIKDEKRNVRSFVVKLEDSDKESQVLKNLEYKIDYTDCSITMKNVYGIRSKQYDIGENQTFDEFLRNHSKEQYLDDLFLRGVRLVEKTIENIHNLVASKTDDVDVISDIMAEVEAVFEEDKEFDDKSVQDIDNALIQRNIPFTPPEMIMCYEFDYDRVAKITVDVFVNQILKLL